MGRSFVVSPCRSRCWRAVPAQNVNKQRREFQRGKVALKRGEIKFGHGVWVCGRAARSGRDSRKAGHQAHGTDDLGFAQGGILFGVSELAFFAQ